MIHFLIGKPRSGKSLRAAGIIVEQLTTTERIIVTNMRLDLAELQDYCDKKGFKIHVFDRVREITDEQTPFFFLYREVSIDPSFATLGEPTDKKKGMVDYTPVFDGDRFYVGNKKQNAEGAPSPLKGVCYVLDEIHTHFPARDYQRTGVHLPFYLSQHGKLNDMVLMITQNLKFCDPELYRAAQDFTYCRNRRLEKYGAFRGENKLEAKTYFSPLTNPDAQAAAQVVTYKIDDIARCYDTSAGVGMPGGGVADGGQRAKGFPLKVAVAIGVMLLVGVWFVFAKILPHVTDKMLAPALGGKSEAAKNLAKPIIPHSPIAPSSESVEEQKVECEGYVLDGRRTLVFLSDGRTLGENSGLERITSAGVVVSGKFIPNAKVKYVDPDRREHAGLPVAQIGQ